MTFGFIEQTFGFTNGETTPVKKQPEIAGSIVGEKNLSDEDYHGVVVVHHGREWNEIVQKIVNYSWKLWWYDFLAMIECENGQYNLKALGDHGHAHWLCQINDRWHKDIPADYYTNWVVAVEYCYQKWKEWVPFYWPGRWINWQRCYDYIRDRYTFIE